MAVNSHFLQKSFLLVDLSGVWKGWELFSPHIFPSVPSGNELETSGLKQMFSFPPLVILLFSGFSDSSISRLLWAREARIPKLI